MTDTLTTTPAEPSAAAQPGDIAAGGSPAGEGALPANALPPDSALVDTATANQGMIEKALDLLATGGPVVAVLAVMSFVALMVILVKLWQFAMARIWERGVAREALDLYRTGLRREAAQVAAGSANPVAQCLARAFAGQALGLPEAKTREEVVRYGKDALETLRSHFRVLEVIASLAPLLGLFGTVLGMIEAFQQLEAAGNQVNPSILSGGIWEALLTTAVGLAVAIPTVALLSWLERQIDRLAHDMEDAVTQVFTQDLSPTPEETDSHAFGGARPAPQY